jgi:hypothetical protein
LSAACFAPTPMPQKQSRGVSWVCCPCKVFMMFVPRHGHLRVLSE